MTLDELIALGEKATPNWISIRCPNTDYDDYDDFEVLRKEDPYYQICSGADDPEQRNADYIAALSPSDLLPMLSLLKELLEKEPTYTDSINGFKYCTYCDLAPRPELPRPLYWFEHKDTCPWQLGQRFLKETT